MFIYVYVQVTSARQDAHTQLLQLNRPAIISAKPLGPVAGGYDSASLLIETWLVSKSDDIVSLCAPGQHSPQNRDEDKYWAAFFLVQGQNDEIWRWVPETDAVDKAVSRRIIPRPSNGKVLASY